MYLILRTTNQRFSSPEIDRSPVLRHESSMKRLLMQTNMHIMCLYPDWSIYRIDYDDVLNYSHTIHTLLPTDSMSPVLDVKPDQRHCSSPQ